MQRPDHLTTGVEPVAEHIEAIDVKRIVGFVALFSASFEGALRQLTPALTLSQLAALEAIHRVGHLRPFRLASDMRISRQLAWQTCKRLEGLGLVEVGVMAAGKRGVEVKTTELGVAHLAQVNSLHEKLAASLGQPGTKGERFDVRAVRRGLRILSSVAAVQLPQAGETEDGTQAARVRKHDAHPGEAAPNGKRVDRPGGQNADSPDDPARPRRPSSPRGGPKR